MTNKGFVPKAEVLDIIEVDVDEALLKKFPEVKLLNEEKVMLIKKWLINDLELTPREMVLSSHKWAVKAMVNNYF